MTKKARRPVKCSTMIFDFDGTIANTFDLAVSVLNRLSYKYNFNRINASEIETVKSKSATQLISDLGISKSMVPIIVSSARREMNRQIEKITPIDGVKNLVIALQSRGFNLGILTSNSSKNVKAFLAANQMNYFSFIQAYSSLWGKNIQLRRLIKRFQLPRRDVLYIGDEMRDIDAARKSGVAIAAVTWGYNSKSVILQHQPDFILSVPNEMLEIVEKNEKEWGDDKNQGIRNGKPSQI